MLEQYLMIGLVVGVTVFGAARLDARAALDRVHGRSPPTTTRSTAADTQPFSTMSPNTEDLSLAKAIVHTTPERTLPLEAERKIVARARLEVERGVKYDASYRLLPTYPNGDVPADRGACTDVVIRAYRAVDVDLQVLVHEDVLASPSDYDLGETGDANVDHRRVHTLHTYFMRNALSLGTDPKSDPSSFRAGDVVFFAWKRCYAGWRCIPEHVAIVSDRIGPRGLPLVLQNGGPYAKESDGLDHPTLVGHFRLNAVVRSASRSQLPTSFMPSGEPRRDLQPLIPL